MAVQIQMRNGTASQWTTANPTLAVGEIGVETDTGKFKVGNGSTAWSSLTYSSGIQGPSGSNGTNGTNGTNGNTILSGAGAPSSGTGVNGDFYLDLTNTVLYGPKASGAWPGSGTSLKGSVAGSTGSTDNAILRADGTGGATAQASAVTISDSGVIAGGTIQDGVFAITDGSSVDLNPANGAIQTWTLGANRTPTATSFASGQSIILVLTAGANSVTWTTVAVTWTKQGGGGTAPTLSSSGKTIVILYKIGSTVYGSYLGDA